MLLSVSSNSKKINIKIRSISEHRAVNLLRQRQQADFRDSYLTVIR